MTTEGFLPWSAVPLDTAVLFAACEPPCAIGVVPFTGESVDFAFCAEAPAAVGGVCVAVLVAFAYDLTGSCAGTAPDDGDVVRVEAEEAASEAGRL